MSGAPRACGHGLGGGRLAHARLALEEQRLAERGGEVERGGGALVEEVVDGVETRDHVVGIDERARSRHPLPRQEGLVVLLGVDVEGHRPRHPHLRHRVPARLEQLPHAPCRRGAWRGRRTRRAGTRTGDRCRRRSGRPPAARRRPRGATSPPRATVTPGWSPSSSTNPSAAASTLRQRGDDRRRAPVGGLGVLDHLDPTQVDLGAHLVGGRAERHQELVERAGARQRRGRRRAGCGRGRAAAAWGGPAGSTSPPPAPGR